MTATSRAPGRAALVVQRLAAAALALLARAERPEVLRRLGHRVGEELHLHAPRGASRANESARVRGPTATDLDVEEDARIRHGHEKRTQPKHRKMAGRRQRIKPPNLENAP